MIADVMNSEVVCLQEEAAALEEQFKLCGQMEKENWNFYAKPSFT